MIAFLVGVFVGVFVMVLIGIRGVGNLDRLERQRSESVLTHAAAVAARYRNRQ